MRTRQDTGCTIVVGRHLGDGPSGRELIDDGLALGIGGDEGLRARLLTARGSTSSGDDRSA